VPVASATATVAGNAQPSRVCARPAATAASASSEPTDRSMPPAAMMKVIGTAISPVSTQ
jgi:hypothetical protein